MVGEHTGLGSLQLLVEGLNNSGAAGDRFVTRLQAKAVRTSLLDMVYSDFETSASIADFEDIRNADFLRLSTPQTLLIALMHMFSCMSWIKLSGFIRLTLPATPMPTCCTVMPHTWSAFPILPKGMRTVG